MQNSVAIVFVREEFIDLCHLFSQNEVQAIRGLDRVKKAMRAFSFHTIPNEWFESLDGLAAPGLWAGELGTSDNYLYDQIADPLKNISLELFLDGTNDVSGDVANILSLGCYLEVLYSIWREKLIIDDIAKYRHRNLVFKGKRAAGKVEKIGRELGIDKDVFAYLQGVPLEDVVGHKILFLPHDDSKIVIHGAVAHKRLFA